ncbi:MAG: rhomboid family intramembrane serine protease [Puniceicoccales bacterium]|jgi:membrane associated rhomboid family serine protease|nr:rhomboid family intramembrane serine protease [Puniceicoccales bacterium]
MSLNERDYMRSRHGFGTGAGGTAGAGGFGGFSLPRGMSPLRFVWRLLVERIRIALLASRPSATGRAVQLLVAAAIVQFLVTAIGGAAGSAFLDANFALSAAGVRSLRLWTPLTYALLHEGLFHFLFNVLMLWFAGSAVEKLAGARTVLTLLAGGALAGAAAWLAVALNATAAAPPTLCLGASAAVYAVLAWFLARQWRERLTFILLVFPVNIRAKWALLALVGIAAAGLLGSEIPHTTGAWRAAWEHDNYAHSAHLGGLLWGLAVFAFGVSSQRRRLRRETTFGVPSGGYGTTGGTTGGGKHNVIPFSQTVNVGGGENDTVTGGTGSAGNGAGSEPKANATAASTATDTATAATTTGAAGATSAAGAGAPTSPRGVRRKILLHPRGVSLVNATRVVFRKKHARLALARTTGAVTLHAAGVSLAGELGDAVVLRAPRLEENAACAVVRVRRGTAEIHAFAAGAAAHNAAADDDDDLLALLANPLGGQLSLPAPGGIPDAAGDERVEDPRSRREPDTRAPNSPAAGTAAGGTGGEHRLGYRPRSRGRDERRGRVHTVSPATPHPSPNAVRRVANGIVASGRYTPSDSLRGEVNRLLEKIYESGLESLSHAERETLDRASATVRRRRNRR